jgi:hypothetical protein
LKTVVRRGRPPTHQNSTTGKEPEIDNVSRNNKYKSLSQFPKESNGRSKRKDIECNCYCCRDSRYEKFNQVDEDGDSVYAISLEDLPQNGRTYIALDTTISETEREELWKRLGPSQKNNLEDVY